MQEPSCRKGSPDCFSFFTLLTSFSTDWPTGEEKRLSQEVGVRSANSPQRHAILPDLSCLTVLLRGLTDRKSGGQQGLCWELSHREPASSDSEVETVGLGVRKPTGREKAATTGSWAPKSVNPRRKELLLPLDSPHYPVVVTGLW